MNLPLSRLMLSLTLALGVLSTPVQANHEDPLEEQLYAFQILPENAPVTPEQFGDLAFLLLEAGRAHEAVPVFEALARTRPDSFNRLSLGVARERAGDLEGAERELRTLYDDSLRAAVPGSSVSLIEPGMAPTVQIHLAAVLIRLNRLEEARRHVSELQRLQPWSGDVKLLEAWLSGCPGEALRLEAESLGVYQLTYRPWVGACD